MLQFEYIHCYSLVYIFDWDIFASCSYVFLLAHIFDWDVFVSCSYVLWRVLWVVVHYSVESLVDFCLLPVVELVMGLEAPLIVAQVAGFWAFFICFVRGWV